MALDLDPAHLPTLAALRVIAIDAADWDRAARYLDQEQINTEAPRARASLLVELGKLRDEMLGEHEQAVQAYELALQSDPDNEDAAMPLVNEYMNTEQWPRAEPLAEMLAKKAASASAASSTACRTQLRQGARRAQQERAGCRPGPAPPVDLTDQETIWEQLATFFFEKLVLHLLIGTVLLDWILENGRMSRYPVSVP